MADSTTVSFEKDIMPMFYQYHAQMLWRFDLTKKEDVQLNYDKILQYIQQDIMPPAPYSPFTSEQKETFQDWGTQKFPD